MRLIYNISECIPQIYLITIASMQQGKKLHSSNTDWTNTNGTVLRPEQDV